MQKQEREKSLHFVESRSIDSASDSFGNDGSRKDQIIQNGFMDGSEGSISGSHLGFMSFHPF